MEDALGHPREPPASITHPKGETKENDGAAPHSCSPWRADSTLQQNEGSGPLLSRAVGPQSQSSEQGPATVLGDLFGLTLPQIPNPRDQQGAASVSRAWAWVRGAICPQRDVGSWDGGGGGAPLSCPELFTGRNGLTGACAQRCPPRNRQAQEGRARGPQRCSGCGEGKRADIGKSGRIYRDKALPLP